jgi:hypothetical protein
MRLFQILVVVLLCTITVELGAVAAMLITGRFQAPTVSVQALRPVRVMLCDGGLLPVPVGDCARVSGGALDVSVQP